MVDSRVSLQTEFEDTESYYQPIMIITWFHYGSQRVNQSDTSWELGT